ncbi:MAG: hypothetical protein ABSH06_17880 [Thermodesulfobacteriota bacterium]
MDPKDLVKVWDAPDHSRLTPKQMSIRLPILVAAKVSALCELYPRTSKSQIIGDLLATALDHVEAAMPSKKGKYVHTKEIGRESEEEPLYEDVGLKGRFRTLTEKYLRGLEKEAGIKEPLDVPFAYVGENGEDAEMVGHTTGDLKYF